ncbi:DMT family transporter [Clostridium carboxidivorans]|uniref:DMT family transporter n=1 Tax=Clostridium carboxidivorans TaxID=217159 RepID=UPI0001D38E54|nr:DMT family transporter [Clostridium carboxidivorans]EFG89110.1 membrane protein, putative [Clostridium carboxidivorans P7]
MKKGYGYSIISAILFGTAGIFVKLSLKIGLDSISLLTVQYIIAVFLMFTTAFITGKEKLNITKIQLIRLSILGVVGNTFMTIFYYKAFEYLPVAMVTMLLFTYPIMVLIYSIIFHKQNLDKRKILVIFMAFLGCLLTLNILVGNFKYSIKGVIFGLLSALFYAFMNLYTEKKLFELDSLSINAYSTLFSLISLLIYRWPTFLFKENIQINALIYVAILAIVCEVIPLTLLYGSIKYIGALKVSIISNLEIPTAMIVSSFILKEQVTYTQVIGALFIVYAVYLIRKEN